MLAENPIDYLLHNISKNNFKGKATDNSIQEFKNKRIEIIDKAKQLLEQNEKELGKKYFDLGYKQCEEDNQEKKYTKEDLIIFAENVLYTKSVMTMSPIMAVNTFIYSLKNKFDNSQK